MKYTNKKGETIIYKRNYQRERMNATGYVNIDTISFTDKMKILSMYVYDELTINEIYLKSTEINSNISKRKVKALIKHFRSKEDEYYETVDGIYRRMF